MYGLKLITAPTEEPVSLTEAKAWLRVEHDADDVKVRMLVKAARGAIEKLSGRQLVTATWQMSLDSFPWPQGWAFLESPLYFPDPHQIRLPKAPLQAVSQIQYVAMDGTLQTLDPSIYDVDTASDPGRIVLGMAKVWPVCKLTPAAVKITFVAGYGLPQAVPEELKTAIKMVAASFYEHAGEDGNMQAIPPAALALVDLTANGEREYGF